MLKGFAQIIETFGMDDECLENAGVVVEAVEVIEHGPINDEMLEVTLADANGNKQVFQMIRVETDF